MAGNDSYTKLLIHSATTDGSVVFTDSSSVGRTITVVGDTHHEADQAYFDGTSIYFDGSGDYLTVPSAADLAFGSVDFTVDLWLLVPSLPSNAYVFDFGSNGGTLSLATGKLRYYNPSTGTTGALYTGGPILAINTWYHIAVVREAGITTLYVGGASVASQTDARNYPAAVLSIGRYGGGGNYFIGYLDEVRVSVGVARWNTTFTPASEPYSGGVSYVSILSALVGQYADVAVVQAAMIGQYALVMEQSIIGRYGDAAQVQTGLVGRYADAAQVQAALIGRYGDMVPVLAALEGRYHLMHAVVAGLVGQYAICGTEVLAGLEGRYDLRERNEIIAALEGYYSLLPSATIQQITCPVRIGGVAVRWSSVSWTLSGDSYLIEATIILRDVAEFNSIAKMDTVEIDWAGVTYHLFVATKLRSRSISGDAGAAEYGAEYTIIARSLTAGLDAPYALPVTRSWPATTLASAIAADLIAPLSDILTLDFRLEDWLQPGGTFFVTDEAPLEGLRKLAAIVGGVIQTSPGNALILRPADPVPPSAWATTAPAWTIEDSGLFSDAESEEESNAYNVITVTNQGESNRSTRFEVEDISEYRKRVRGYRVPWQDFGLTTSGGAWVTIEDGGIVEEQVVDELVEFIDGASSAAKPIYSQVSAMWLQASLGTVTAAEDGSLTSAVVGNSLAKITYTTRCHVWIGTSDRSEEVQFYEVEA